MLEIKDLHVSVAGDTEIIKGLNLTIPAGEVHAIMGPNGSGKSTLSYGRSQQTSLLGSSWYGLQLCYDLVYPRQYIVRCHINVLVVNHVDFSVTKSFSVCSVEAKDVLVAYANFFAPPAGRDPSTVPSGL